MQLDGKNAIVYGASGSMGGAVARGFAAAGARVFLASRTPGPLETLAAQIRDAGGRAEVRLVDAMDRDAVDAHAAEVARSAGSLDISVNAVSVPVVQDVPLTEIGLDDFLAPITQLSRTHFITATAAARQMSTQGSGVVIMLSASSSYETRHQMGGFSLANAGIEALTRALAGEFGRPGVRVVGIRSNFTPETYPEVTAQDVAPLVRDTLLGRLPRLAEIAGTAVYLASPAAGAMTGAVVNLSCGAIVGS